MQHHPFRAPKCRIRAGKLPNSLSFWVDSPRAKILHKKKNKTKEFSLFRTYLKTRAHPLKKAWQIWDFKPWSRPHQTASPANPFLPVYAPPFSRFFFGFCREPGQLEKRGSSSSGNNDDWSVWYSYQWSGGLSPLLFSHCRVAKIFCCLILDFGKILSLSSI